MCGAHSSTADNTDFHLNTSLFLWLFLSCFFSFFNLSGGFTIWLKKFSNHFFGLSLSISSTLRTVNIISSFSLPPCDLCIFYTVFHHLFRHSYNFPASPISYCLFLLFMIGYCYSGDFTINRDRRWEFWNLSISSWSRIPIWSIFTLLFIIIPESPALISPNRPL